MTVLHVNSAVGIAFRLVIASAAHQNKLHVAFEIVILFLGNEVVGSPLLAAIGHEHLAVVGRTFHHLPSDGHVLLGPHFPILFD